MRVTPHQGRGLFGRLGPALLSLLVLSFGLAPTAARAQQTIRLTAIGGYATSANWTQAFYDHFIPEVDRQLGRTGHYKIEWITAFSGTVAKPGGVLEALQHGIGDIGIVVTPFHGDKLTFYNLTYFTPFVSTDLGLLAGTMSGLVARHPVLKEVFEDYNQVYLDTAGPIDNYVIAMTDPFTRLSDYRGKKVAGIGTNLRYLDGLGAIGVRSYLSNYYNILTSGMVDGAIMWAEAAANLKFYRIAPYLIEAGIGGAVSIVVNVNKPTWNRLPEEVRQALRRAAVNYRRELASYVMAASERGLLEFAARGGTVIRLSQDQRRQWAENMPNLALEWAATMERRGLPGRQILREYMDIMRAANQPIVRHWDRELPD